MEDEGELEVELEWKKEMMKHKKSINRKKITEENGNKMKKMRKTKDVRTRRMKRRKLIL